MTEVLWKALVVASGGWLSIGSILIVLLLMSTGERGVQKGVAYVVGYIAGYLLIGGLFLLVGSHLGGMSTNAGGGIGATIGSILFGAMGLFFLTMSIRKWRNPPAPDAPPPRLFRALHEWGPRKALGIGAMVATINFKNLAIFLAAVALLLSPTLSVLDKLFGLVLVVLNFCAFVIVPVLLFLIFAERATPMLRSFQLKLETHNHVIGICALGLFGTLFLVRGVSGLL